MNTLDGQSESGATAAYAALVDAGWLPPKRNGTVDDVHTALAAARNAASPQAVPISLLRSDRFLDRVLDKLTVRAGHPANTDALGLARWDLKAAIQETIAEVYAQ